MRVYVYWNLGEDFILELVVMIEGQKGWEWLKI